MNDSTQANPEPPPGPRQAGDDSTIQPGDDGPIIVGIGASAGGLTALRTFFSRVKPDTGLSFVVVVHLPPDHESYLPDLIQAHTLLPVHQVTATTRIEPNHVYIIPPGAYLSAVDTHLRLSEMGADRSRRGPIDHFLRTLAVTHGPRAIAVVLTGTGSDGALGVKAIKEGGGLTVVQDPVEAEFDGMPRAALATGVADIVLPVAEMPARLVGMARARPVVPAATAPTAPEEEGTDVLLRILELVRARTRRDFSRHKRSTIRRRIERRMQVHEVETLGAYLQLLREQPEEIQTLADEFLITVTTFFRNPEVYAALQSRFVPRLFEGKTAADSVRVWSVGCATGEEAYSIAMLLFEEATRRGVSPRIEVFASDLHQGALKVAREGVYTAQLESDVSPERLRAFFIKEDGSYRIRSEVRERVIFAQHNVLADPPFSKIDLVICRNLLIYLERDVQREVLALFHYALNPDGLLLLGQSEGVDDPGLFLPEDKSIGLQRKRNTPAREPRLPVFLFSRPGSPEESGAAVSSPSGYGAVHHRMVERYAPPSILVGPDHKVVHVSDNAGRYLRVPGGEPTTSVFSVVRDELRAELLAALRAAEQSGQPARSRPLPLSIQGVASSVVVDVRPATRHPDDQGFLLVIFDERPEPSAEDLTPGPETRITDSEIRTELELTRRRLHSVAEEYESSREAMKASNEELQSVNEELRSTMEELETSREELQSINEELLTLNQENRHKVEELQALTSDLQNLMVTTDIATLFLDRDLRIARFTPRLADLFSARETDRGRPVTDLRYRLDYPEFGSDAEAVRDRLAPVEREVRDDTDRWYLARILPYRTAEGRVTGVVATFVDITSQKRAVQAIAEAKEHAEDIVQSIDEPLMILGPDLRVKSANPAFYAHFRVEPGEVEGRLIYSLGDGEWDIPVLRSLLEQVLPENKSFNDYEVTHRFTGIGERTILLNARRLGRVPLIVLGFRDVTALKRVERELRETDRRKDDFLATLAHELRNPLAAISGALIAEQAARADATADDAHNLLIIQRQTKHLVRLVDDLLDISRITQGKVELRRDAVDIAGSVRDALEMTMTPNDAARCEATLLAAPEPVVVDADPARLTQVFSNLIGNAAKFSAGQPRILITVSRDASDAVVSIRDRGVGIPSHMLSRIFDPFVQVDASWSKSQGGVGLGLTLVRRLVELHGGRVEARSPGVGLGSEFIVHLPLAFKLPAVPDAEGDRGPELDATPAADSAPAGGRAFRVVVIDDNHDAADTLAAVLGMQGHEVRVGYNGPEGLSLIEAWRPDVALIDLGLPGMDGYEVARRIRANGAVLGTRLVAVSGWGQDSARRLSAEAGFDEHLVKPASFKDVDAAVLAARRS